MRKVLVCKSELLPYSETFIKEQVLAYSSWKPVIVGTHTVPGLALDGLDVRLLHKSAPGTLGRVYRKALRELELPPPGTVNLMKRESASLVHVHFGTEVVAFWPIIRRLGLPIVVTLHGSDINIYKECWHQGGIAARKYPERLVSIAHQPRVHIIAVSEAIKQRAIDYGIAGERIAVQYIGVDTRRFKPSGSPVASRKRRILFIARLVEKKGGRLLVEAFARVRKHVADAELVMVGDGPLRSDLEKLAVQLGVAVRFTGRLSGAEIAQQLHEARVFCLPSVTAENGDAEGLGIVLLEAQACGVPVVTSARGGMGEGVLHGVTGFAFAERDVAALADYLTRILRDDALATSMSAAARQFVVDKFDLHKRTAALEAYYATVVEG